MKHYQVVAAVVVRPEDGKVLCVQRGATRYAYTAYKYEFPGGKIEPGETPQEALHRELLEEMDYDLAIGPPVATVEHVYPDFGITLQAFRCTPRNANFCLKEHQAYRWLTIEELPQLDWAAADVDIVSALLREERS